MNDEEIRFFGDHGFDEKLAGFPTTDTSTSVSSDYQPMDVVLI
jgi:hypothetical protein